MTSKAKIVIIDDDENIIHILEARLSSYGYKVVSFQNGENIIDKIKLEKPNLILLDILMPNKDGFIVCSELKENKHTKNIPIIMLTSKTDTESVKKALYLGAVDYIAKPFNPSLIIQKIENVLGKKKKTVA